MHQLIHVDGVGAVVPANSRLVSGSGPDFDSHIANAWQMEVQQDGGNKRKLSQPIVTTQKKGPTHCKLALF